MEELEYRSDHWSEDMPRKSMVQCNATEWLFFRGIFADNFWYKKLLLSWRRLGKSPSGRGIAKKVVKLRHRREPASWVFLQALLYNYLLVPIVT